MLTREQRITRRDWRKAHKSHRNAERGFRAQTQRALQAAATNILRADIAARRTA